ncbi:MAG: GxxExxY protein [Chloroflexota bacterium]
MNTTERELILKDEVYTIVSAAMEVSNILGAGFFEAVYQEALELELGLRGVPFMSQLPVQINYKGYVLSKEYVPDLICFDQIIVELKAIKQLTSLEEAQLLNYLKATGKTVGVLLNFGTPKLEWKRMVFTHPSIRG